MAGELSSRLPLHRTLKGAWQAVKLILMMFFDGF
jgi:hypothetical protein